jgi:hypothetical protein
MSREDWSLIMRHTPNCFRWPEMWAACIIGAVTGAALLEFLIHICDKN